MTISVLMSVYKSEKPQYLDEAIRSIWDNQTLKPNQIVLVQDGPLGKELEQIIDKWKTYLGVVLCILKNEQNQGLTKSLNRGISMITSDLIARMDSDDISEPDRFRLQHDYLETHKDVHILGGSLQEFNDKNPSLTVRHYPLTPESSRKYICKASPLAHPTVMMRREIFDHLNYDERYRTSQDIALWYDCLQKGYKIANLYDITIRFRRDDDVFMRRGKDKAWNEFRIYMHGIYRLFGPVTYKYIYPICRLVFRLMPRSVIKYVYGSPLRKNLLKK